VPLIDATPMQKDFQQIEPTLHRLSGSVGMA
jgi:hypothetical protein